MMGKLRLLFCLFTLLLGCSNDSNDSTDTIYNPDDIDGDGVTNQIEIVDNTDPEDPCSVIIDHIYLPSLSEAWKLLDCDGDGVNNWNEIEGSTDPLLECDLNVDQQTLDPSNEWLQIDCDLDGVSNGQEVQNNSDINDNCSLNLDHQILDLNNPNHNDWLSLDCDNDGRDNENEILYGTNPFDATDFSGSGSTITEILQFTSQNGVLFRSYLFEENNNFDKIIDFNGNAILDFNYDVEGNLISVLTDDFSISFAYTNGDISQITKQINNEVVITQVVYDGNNIFTYDGDEPDGLYSYKYTFESAEGKLIEKGQFYTDNLGIIKYNLTTFIYDNLYENLLSSTSINYGYNSDTNELIDLGSTSGSFIVTYSYSDQVLNPVYNAFNSYYFNYVLAPDILKNAWISTENGAPAHFSKNYITGFGWTSGNLSHSYGYSYNYVQENYYPIAGGFGDFSIQYDYEFYYE